MSLRIEYAIWWGTGGGHSAMNLIVVVIQSYD